MDFKFLHTRIKYLILNPEKAWDAIHSENRPVKEVRGSFFLPLIILVGLAAFTGSLIFTSSGLSPAYSVFAGIKYLILYYFVVYAGSLILREISYAMDLGRDFSISFKMIAYSISPLLICQIASRLFESFIFVNVLAIYGLYIFWIGMEKMLTPPEHKKMPMVIAITVTIIGLIVASNIILTMIFDRIYFTFFA